MSQQAAGESIDIHAHIALLSFLREASSQVVPLAWR
jgi:hypothetical protein